MMNCSRIFFDLITSCAYGNIPTNPNIKIVDNLSLITVIELKAIFNIKYIIARLRNIMFLEDNFLYNKSKLTNKKDLKIKPKVNPASTAEFIYASVILTNFPPNEPAIEKNILKMLPKPMK